MVEHKSRHEQAKDHVRKAFGDNVDFSPGTSGCAMVQAVELELDNLEELRKKIMALAESMFLDTGNDLDKLLR